MRRLLQILTVLTISATSAFAQLGVSIERTITLPNTHGLVRNIVFQDYDFDGTSEVAFWDDLAVYLYSPQLNQVIWSVPTNSDSLFERELLFADCNRDSIPDIVLAGWEKPYLRPDRQQRCYVTMFDGLTTYATSTTNVFWGPVYEAWMLWGSGDGGALALQDFDHDGFGELLFSYHKTDYLELGSPFYMQYTSGRSQLYHSFPDSVSWSSNSYFEVLQKHHTWSDSLISIFSSSMAISAIHTLVDPETISFQEQFGMIDSLGQLVHTPQFDTTCQSGDLCTQLSSVELLCSGNLQTTSDNHELVFQSIYVTPDTVDSQIYSAGVKLSCYVEQADHSLQEVWSHHIDQKQYRNSVYLSQYPGFFFAFENNELVMLRGDLGNEFHRTSILPNGKLSWANIYPDSSARLIASHDSTIEVYTIDASTGADTRDNQPLPAKFTLGTPYPNPFNPTVTIPVETPRKMNLTITAYNILGEKVEILFSGKKTAGQHRFTWNAGAYPSGIYFISVSSDGEKQTEKISLIK